MELHTELKKELYSYRSRTFSDNTRRTYACQINAYFKFCNLMDQSPLPASKEFVALYAAYLARRMKAKSVR